MKAPKIEDAAKADIIARPEVTGEGREESERKPPYGGKVAQDSGIPAQDAATVEPDAMEKAASRVISKAIDDAKAIIGMEPDSDFSTLMAETLGGIFSAMRVISGRPWLRYAVAFGALGISIVPPVLRHMAAKAAEPEGDKK